MNIVNSLPRSVLPPLKKAARFLMKFRKSNPSATSNCLSRRVFPGGTCTGRRVCPGSRFLWCTHVCECIYIYIFMYIYLCIYIYYSALRPARSTCGSQSATSPLGCFCRFISRASRRVVDAEGDDDQWLPRDCELGFLTSTTTW